jgi:hypothetical protein
MLYAKQAHRGTTASNWIRPASNRPQRREAVEQVRRSFYLYAQSAPPPVSVVSSRMTYTRCLACRRHVLHLPGVGLRRRWIG